MKIIKIEQRGFFTFHWVLLVLASFRNIDKNSHSVSDTLIEFSLPFILLILLLILICYITGEKPKWNWGN